MGLENNGCFNMGNTFFQPTFGYTWQDLLYLNLWMMWDGMPEKRCTLSKQDTDTVYDRKQFIVTYRIHSVSC